MLLRKRVAGAAFQILLKFPGEIQEYERGIKLHLPRLAFRRVGAFAGVVLRKADLEIVRMTSVEFTRVGYAFQNVCVSTVIRLREALFVERT